MATLRILSAVYDFKLNSSCGAGSLPAVCRAPQRNPREGFQHSTGEGSKDKGRRTKDRASLLHLRPSTFDLRPFLLPLCAAALLLTPACSKPEKPKLNSTYVFGQIQLQFPDRKHFKIDFEPNTRWAQLGPLEGETTEFGTFFALLPKTLGGRTEEQITQDSYKLAQQQGIQTDLMAVYNLMRKIKMEIGEEGKTLTVTDPTPKDPDKHPLRGAVFGSGI
jgi:hypothetical protein